MSINSIKYTLSYTIGTTSYSKVLRPKDEGFTLSVDEDDYKRRLKNDGKFTFYNDPSNGISDFDVLRSIEQFDIFQRVYLLVQKNGCPDITLYFSLADCEIDADRCTYIVTPQAEDEYTCVMDDIETEYNVLKEVAPAERYIITNPANLELVTFTKRHIISYAPPYDAPTDALTYWGNTSPWAIPADTQGVDIPYNETHPAYPSGMVKGVIINSQFLGWPSTSDTIFNVFTYNNANLNYFISLWRIYSMEVVYDFTPINSTTTWASVTQTWCIETAITLNDPITGANVPPAGSGWMAAYQLLQGSALSCKWARIPFYNSLILAAPRYQLTQRIFGEKYSYELLNPYTYDSAGHVDIYRGRMLNETIQMFLDKSACGLTLKSEFLQSETNPVTGEVNPLYVLNQCSDIKDPDSSEAATYMMYKFRDLLENLEYLFDAKWVIKDGNFIIEHISYFENGYSYLQANLNTIDLSTRTSVKTGQKEIIRSNKYNYDKQNIFKKETIAQSQYLDYDFAKLNIDYAVEILKDEKTTTRQISIITDCSGVLTEPANFNNDGVVMVAFIPTLVDELTGAIENVVINEKGYRTNEEVTNGWLCISNLFNRFYRHNRIKLQGKIENDIDETFLTETDKVLQTVSVSDCDMSLLMDENLIKTELGTGRVLSAKHKVMNATTELTILL